MEIIIILVQWVIGQYDGSHFIEALFSVGPHLYSLQKAEKIAETKNFYITNNIIKNNSGVKMLNPNQVQLEFIEKNVLTCTFLHMLICIMA